MHHIMIAADSTATARGASLVLRWFDLGHALLVENMRGLGVAVPARFMAGDQPADDQVDTEAEDVVEEDEPLEEWLDCHTCGGSGGATDGYFRCPACAGRGRLRNRAWVEERDAAEADHLYDVAKDERAERGGR